MTQTSPDTDIDQVEEMLKKTGCIDKHYKVQVSKVKVKAKKKFVFPNSSIS